MMQKPGIDTRYIYAVARIRVLETRLLGDASFERLVEQETLSDAVRVLGEFPDYADAASLAKGKADFESILRAVLKRTYDLIQGLLAQKSLLGPFYVKAEMVEGVRELDASAIDSTVYAAFHGAWKNNLFLKGYIKTAIDLENIKICIRTKALEWPRGVVMNAFIENGYIPTGYFRSSIGIGLADFFKAFEYRRYERIMREGLERYERAGDLSPLEKLCDDMLIDYITPAKYLHFGAEPLISYVLAREFEVKNVRSILVGKANGFKPGQIREVLRKSYV